MSLKKNLNKKIQVERDTSRLRDQLETEIIPDSSEAFQDATDSLDPELLAYVESFIEDYNQIGRLGPIDLTTPESAREAMKLLDTKKQELDSQIRTARALRDLLLQRR